MVWTQVGDSTYCGCIRSPGLRECSIMVTTSSYRAGWQSAEYTSGIVLAEGFTKKTIARTSSRKRSQGSPPHLPRSRLMEISCQHLGSWPTKQAFWAAFLDASSKFGCLKERTRVDQRNLCTMHIQYTGQAKKIVENPFQLLDVDDLYSDVDSGIIHCGVRLDSVDVNISIAND
jgi:hypothetical protein